MMLLDDLGLALLFCLSLSCWMAGRLVLNESMMVCSYSRVKTVRFGSSMAIPLTLCA